MNMIQINQQQIKNSVMQDEVYTLNQVILGLEDDTEVVLEKDLYTLRCKYAYQQFCYMTNNDFGLKDIAFPILGKKNIVIDGQGSELSGIGRISPFYLSECENITLKNFIIDYPRPFFSQGEVIESSEDGVVIKIDKEKYPYISKDTAITFVGEDYTSEFTHGLLPFTKDEKRPPEHIVDSAVFGALVAEELEEGILKLNHKFRVLPPVGTMLSIKHERRYVPAIAVNACKNIKIENIWVKHAGTMGLVAQFTENITLDGMKVCLDPNTDRVISANADATHFVGCRGTILVENCVFENQLDDILNVHGNYLRIVKKVDATHVVAEIPHRQQVGAFGLKVGSNITICDDQTMLVEGKSVIKNIHVLNNKYYELELAQPYEFQEEKEYCIDDCDAYPALIYRNNVGGRNRARGLLITTNKEVLVENNVLDCEGATIKISGDMTGWYESGATSKVTIRGNKIRRRNTATWGKGIFDIDPEAEEFEEGMYFHKEIILENNEIELGDFPLVYGGNFAQLVVKDNHMTGKCIKSDADVKFDVKHVGEIKLEGNTYHE